jgi:hypothetical protein
MLNYNLEEEDTLIDHINDALKPGQACKRILVRYKKKQGMLLSVYLKDHAFFHIDL